MNITTLLICENNLLQYFQINVLEYCKIILEMFLLRIFQIGEKIFKIFQTKYFLLTIEIHFPCVEKNRTPLHKWVCESIRVSSLPCALWMRKYSGMKTIIADGTVSQQITTLIRPPFSNISHSNSF